MYYIFHLILIVLVIFDIICVLIQIVVDIIHKDIDNEIIHIFEEIAEIVSLCILSFFLLTILANVILLSFAILNAYTLTALKNIL